MTHDDLGIQAWVVSVFAGSPVPATRYVASGIEEDEAPRLTALREEAVPILDRATADRVAAYLRSTGLTDVSVEEEVI